MRSFALLLAVATLAACQNTPTDTADDPDPTAAVQADATPADPNAPSEEGPTPEEMEAQANMPVTLVADSMPAGPERLGGGAFSGAGGHDVSGTAALYRLDDGSHLVRLENLDSDNGPDLEVWLVRRTTGDVGEGGVSLGALKSIRGNQNYEVPAGTDVSAFAGVSVWCRRFAVNFGTAPLASE